MVLQLLLLLDSCDCKPCAYAHVLVVNDAANREGGVPKPVIPGFAYDEELGRMPERTW